jgi:uncharacterized membrane protein
MTHHLVSRVAVMTLAIVMVVFGIYHFIKPRDMLVYVPNFVPGGIVWVYLVGAAFVVAALAFIFHRQVKTAGYLLATLLIIFVLAIHIPNYLNAGDIDMRQVAFVNVLKDTALAAFAMYIGSNAKNLDRD